MAKNTDNEIEKCDTCYDTGLVDCGMCMGYYDEDGAECDWCDCGKQPCGDCHNGHRQDINSRSRNSL